MNKLFFLVLLLSVPHAFSEEEQGNVNTPPPSQDLDSVESSWNMTDSSYITTISTTRYYVGAGIETAGLIVPFVMNMFGQPFPLLSGWGIGHAIQGRYNDRGWIFTVSSGALYTGLIASVFFIGAEAISATADRDLASALAAITRLNAFAIIASVGILGVSIWGIVDVWDIPSHYKIVKEKPFSVQPLFAFYNEEEIDIGLSLRYKF